MLIGPWAQPASLMSRWKDRGCNLLFGAANDLPKAQWEAAAIGAGMSFVTAPGADPAAEIKQPRRVGFMQPDEPDLITHIARPGSAIGDLKATYQKLKPLGLPVWMNLDGHSFDNVAYDGTPHPSKADASKWGHRAATGGYMAWADLIGFDYYLWTSGRPGAFDITKRLLDRANEWSGGKPLFAYVETCTQGTGKPFTADDYEAQVNTIVNYCQQKGYTLAGLIYFATDPTGKSGWPAGFDVTPPDVVERMKTVHARLNPVPTPPTLEDRVKAIEGQLLGMGQTFAEALAKLKGVEDANAELTRRMNGIAAAAANPTPQTVPQL